MHTTTTIPYAHASMFAAAVEGSDRNKNRTPPGPRGHWRRKHKKQRAPEKHGLAVVEALAFHRRKKGPAKAPVRH
jgi:hypothetical protein